jgi:hypothetical protein
VLAAVEELAPAGVGSVDVRGEEDPHEPSLRPATA